VGPSGCGKTTLADVVMGLLQPDTGAVLVDDLPLSSETMAAWRDGIGYVSQDTFFFHDTVAANLRVGAPDATDAELVRVLGLAAADFVLALPHGLNTVVGDRGVRLSGGERQRLALARALVRNPRLLILDEPTSALDAPNERRIVDAIAALRGRMTILLITHRVWTLDGVDTIVVLDAGRLVESGRWDTLRATTGSRFAALSLDGER
jgi:ATP-binding cassette subfamily C protein